MIRIARFIIRTSAFLRKEIFEILRQPRLVLVLVLGPFLILFLFGIGYRNEALALRTLFVVQEGSQVAQQIEDYADTLGPQLIFMGTTSDVEDALRQLRRDEVDLIAVAPNDAYETVRNNQQAVFTLLHNEIDPFQVDYVTYFGQIYVDEVNRRVLLAVTQEGQSEASTVQEDVAAARTSAAAMREALDRRDAAEARLRQQDLDQNVSALEIAVGASFGLLGGVQKTIGSGDNPGPGDAREDLSAVRENTDALNEIDDDQASYDQEVQRASQIEQDLADLDAKLSEFQRMDPYVLVSPFRSEARSIATVQPDIADYFAPSVIVLLLQHLAVTFAALSFVRERQTGALELFRVSPISSVEALLGKYLSYLLFGGVLAAILTAVMIYGLGVPMLGLWLSYALVIAALLFASLGFGFVISLLAETDSQAVQYAMLLLLTSVFFSGFFLALEALWAPVRAVSWVLPATYSIRLLQDIMLRGYLAHPVLLASLTAIGAVLFFAALVLLRRRMARS